MPKVSILMPVYNGSEYIAEAIDSIICQTFTDWELIIGDDGSTDNIEELVRSFTDKRISFYKNSQNIGHTATKYSLLNKSSGKYIAFLDSDDTSLPKRLQYQVDFLDKNPNYGLCGTWGTMIDPKGKKIKNITFVKDHEYIKSALLFSTVFIQSSLMIRRGLYKEHYYDVEIPLVEDYNFECLLSRECKVHNIPKRLVKYRWHDSNISNTKQEKLSTLSKNIFERELKNLAIYANETELDIHLALRDKSTQTIPNRIFFKEAYDWLHKLGGANQLCRTYKHEIFLATVCYRWMFACKARRAYYKMFQFPVEINFKVFKNLLKILFVRVT